MEEEEVNAYYEMWAYEKTMVLVHTRWAFMDQTTLHAKPTTNGHHLSDTLVRSQKHKAAVVE